MKREQKWVVPRTKTFADPRVAVARHIAWTKPLGPETDYSLPEPDHYNYGGLAKEPVECPLLDNQIFYQDKITKNWWSLYYVPEQLNHAFLIWGEHIPFEICWTPNRQTRMRQRRTLLATRRHDSDMTLPELLYNSGYYSELQTTFNIDITKQLGTPRSKIPIPEQQEEINFD